MSFKKFGLSFFAFALFLSLNACVDSLTEYKFDSLTDDQGVAAQPPSVEPPQAEPTFPDPELVPADPTGFVFGPLDRADVTASLSDRARDLLSNGAAGVGQPNNPPAIFPSLSASGVISSIISNQIPRIVARQPQAPGPVEAPTCDPENDGIQGIRMILSENSMKNLAEDHCESFASIVVSDASSQECHDAVERCVGLTRSSLASAFDRFTDASCVHDFGGSLTHPIEDQYCCDPGTYDLVIQGVFHSGAMSGTRDLIHNTCS